VASAVEKGDEKYHDGAFAGSRRMVRMKAIAIAAEEGWPVDAVVVDRDDPEGPLHRWRDGSLSDAPEVEVDALLADSYWRWVDIDLPENFEEGYLASWKGEVKWVRGTPPMVPSWLPRWMLTIPNPDWAEKLQRRVPKVAMIAGAVGFVIGLVLIAAGGSQAWFSTALAIVLFWQGWAARHKRVSIRTIALRVVPMLFFLVAAAVTARAAAQAFSSSNAARGWIFLAVALLDLLLVILLVALGRAFSDRAKPTPRGSH
jgi:hypothetical protein